MVSEASWQTGAAARSAGARHSDAAIDQRGVESLLLKLVERVAESERRYSDALGDLHKRLDRLSQTAGAVRTGAADDAETLERLHRQINRLGRRFEPEQAEPLDDFERLGRTLTEGMSTAARSAAHTEERELDRRLVETAQRLERSIGNAMPAAAIEALNARLDDISNQMVNALRQVPQRESIQQVERQLAEMGRQLVRAERQLAKVGIIESQLLKLIERIDSKPARPEPAPVAPVDLDQVKDIAQKAATEAARRVMAEEKPATNERLDAMQRDIAALGDKNKKSNEDVANKLQAVQDQLQRIAEQVERSAAAFAEKPRSAFVAPAAQTEEKPASPVMSPLKPSAEARGDKAADRPLKDKPVERKTSFAERHAREDKPAERVTAKSEPEMETPEDLVAAARRGARAAVLRGAQMEAVSAKLNPDVERGGSNRKRTMLIVAAAILLLLSAGVLLFERLKLKPGLISMPPAVEQTAPVPAKPTSEAPSPEVQSGAAAILELERPDSWAPLPAEDTPEEASSRVGDASGSTNIAKSTHLVAADLSQSPHSQYAVLKPSQMAIPPGTTFTFDGASLGGKVMDAAETMPASLPLPPETLGSFTLRQAAAMGDAKAQYVIALRYAQGKGTPRNSSEARSWLERAASSGYAPAQYRLGTLYERGQGVDKDIARARSWYEAAAEKGNIKAMHNLAIGASGREDTQADYEMSAKWHEEAASYGFTDSQFNLGMLYEHGLGRPQDMAEAYKWFALAALSGDAEAAKQRARLEPTLDNPSLARAVQAVRTWKARPPIAEANEPNAAEWDAPAAEPNSELVARAQSMLNRLGYDAGTPDGVMGLRTRAAIQSFERQNGLEETGEVSVPLVTTLERLTS